MRCKGNDGWLERDAGANIPPGVTGVARAGDVWHCTGDVTAAGQTLGFVVVVSLETGLAQSAQHVAQDRYCAVELAAAARREVEQAGLLR